jgi:hypothetical protein
MSYKTGQPVIITKEGVNHVGIILDKYLASKAILYDVLLENRSAFTAINTAKSKQMYINRELTAKLCDTGMIVPTMNYTELFDADQLPIVRG